MQFLADICKSMNEAGYLTIDDLYTLSEKEIIDKIINCEDRYLSESFRKFQEANQVFQSEDPVKDKYCVKVSSKTRYVNPLVQTQNGPVRINRLSKQANEDINNYLNIPKGGYYTYFDFNFVPYDSGIKRQLEIN